MRYFEVVSGSVPLFKPNLSDPSFYIVKLIWRFSPGAGFELDFLNFFKVFVILILACLFQRISEWFFKIRVCSHVHNTHSSILEIVQVQS